MHLRLKKTDLVIEDILIFRRELTLEEKPKVTDNIYLFNGTVWAKVISDKVENISDKVEDSVKHKRQYWVLGVATPRFWTGVVGWQGVVGGSEHEILLSPILHRKCVILCYFAQKVCWKWFVFKKEKT